MIRKTCLLGLGLALCLFMGSSPLQAQTISGDVLDASARTNTPGPQGDQVNGVYGLQNLNSAQIRIGRFITGDGIQVSAVYAFALPDLGAVADPFTTAELEFSFLSVDAVAAAPDYNADLYGISRRELANVVAFDDFFAGPGPDENATSLQEDILTPDTAVGRITSVDIASFLNAQYEGGAGVGQFVFLRFSPDYNTDVLIDDRDGYLVATANNTDATLTPVINFTTGDAPTVLLGDVNLDETVDFLDISPFIARLTDNEFQLEADVNEDTVVDFLDIAVFISILFGLGLSLPVHKTVEQKDFCLDRTDNVSLSAGKVG